MPPPLDLSAVRLDADQVAVLTDGVEQLAVHCRGAAQVAARPAGLGGPEQLAVGQVQGEDIGRLALVSEREQFAAGNGDAGIAVAHTAGLPEQGRAVLGPAGQQPSFLAAAVALGPTPLRPVERPWTESIRVLAGQNGGRAKQRWHRQEIVLQHGVLLMEGIGEPTAG